MKKVLVLTVLVVLIGVNVSFAKDNKKSIETKESRVKEMVSHKIKYPAFASEQKIEGEVYVSFTVKNDGKVNIIRTNSANEELGNYVVEKLQSISFKQTDIEEGKTFNMKFVFELYE